MSLQEIVDKYKAQGVDIFVSENNGGYIVLSRIVVPKELRNQGIGTAFMEELEKYADDSGKRIALTPSKDFGGHINKLKEFYKRFGFVPNKGRNKDFTTQETFLRKPAFENFINSLKTDTNQGLIESILEGFNTIFEESEQLSMFKDEDIKLSPTELKQKEMNEVLKNAGEIISESGNNSIEEILENLRDEDNVTPMLIEALFKVKRIEYKIIEMVDNNKVLVYKNKNGNPMMLFDFTYPIVDPSRIDELITEKVSQGNNIDDIVPKENEILLHLDEEFNKNFWDSPSEVYHGTSEENVKSIQKDGINASNQTRGISNRSVTSAVFTSSEPETPDYYFDKTFKIDTYAMKKDGYTPFVYQEPPIQEKELAEALSHLYGIEDYYYETEQGIDEGTVIFDGDIPAKYLELVK